MSFIICNRSPVIPAKAGIHVARTNYRLIREQQVASVDVKRKLRWVSAFAGMTGERLLLFDIWRIYWVDLQG